MEKQEEINEDDAREDDEQDLEDSIHR